MTHLTAPPSGGAAAAARRVVAASTPVRLGVGVEIRRITNEELLTHALPLQQYAFGRTPAPRDAGGDDERARSLRYQQENTVLVAEEDGTATAVAAAIPMRQNVRGGVYPMAGVAGVATHPLARRKGHVRALLTELLTRMRDDGCAVSALYPFRPSFYARFGYVSMPKQRTVRLAPGGLRPLLSTELPGEVRLERLADGYPAYRDLFERLLAQRHGFAVFPPGFARRDVDADDAWLLTARVDGEVVGAVTYRIAGHNADLAAGQLLVTGPLGRALILRYFAQHVDQVADVVVTVPPDEYPELWLTDLAATIEARIAFPGDASAMVRVLSLEALAGMPAGVGRVVVEVADDWLLAGRYLVEGDGATLAVTRSADGAAPVAVLTAAGLSALVYGLLDPEELVIRGLGRVPDDAAAQLRALWPRRVPSLAVAF